MKIIVSDYDETFYVNDKDIVKNVQLVNKFMRNGIFIIATGRSYYDYCTQRDLYNIKCNYLIINHGATIIKGNKVIYNKSIDNDVAENIIKDLELDKSISNFGCAKKNSRLSLEQNNLTKIHVHYQNKKDAIRIHKIISLKYLEYVKCFLVFNNEAVEIVAKEVNKANAIKHIAALEEITKNNIYAIGDSYTDYEMIKEFNGYAIINSVEQLKEIAIKEYNSVSNLIQDVMGENDEFK